MREKRETPFHRRNIHCRVLPLDACQQLPSSFSSPFHQPTIVHTLSARNTFIFTFQSHSRNQLLFVTCIDPMQVLFAILLHSFLSSFLNNVLEGHRFRFEQVVGYCC